MLKINRRKFSIRFDFFLILGFLIFAKLSSFVPLLSVFDELVIIYFIFFIVLRSFNNFLYIKYLYILFYTFLFYAFLLVFINNLPYKNVVQHFITLKFLFVFLFFSYKSMDYKNIAFYTFLKILTVLYVVSLVLSIFHFIFPGLLMPLDTRGINGITLSGVFFSRILYSEFLLLCLIIILTLRNSSNSLVSFIIRHKNFLVIFTFLLIFLTFTRKDILIGLLLIYFLYHNSLSRRNRLILYFFSFFVLLSLPLINTLFFNELNKQTFTDNQIRLVILNSGLEIFDYYKPLGSGPGTFGTIMSVEYDKIYHKFNVPDRVYKGYGDDERGPIFDVYFINMLVEYGLGIFFFFLICFSIYRSKYNSVMNNLIDVKLFRIAGFLFIFFSCLTVPIFNNIIGYLFFSFLGLMSLSKSINE